MYVTPGVRAPRARGSRARIAKNDIMLCCGVVKYEWYTW